MCQSATLTANKTAHEADVSAITVVQTFKSAEVTYHVSYHVPYHVL
jgi:hypothetical protein